MYSIFRWNSLVPGLSQGGQIAVVGQPKQQWVPTATEIFAKI
jgi:hypothetical protein